MPTRRLTRTALAMAIGAAAAIAMPGESSAQFGGHVDADEVTIWVVGATGGGVKPPKGTTCTRWRQVMGSELAGGALGGAPDGPVQHINAAGVLERLMVRFCGIVTQLVWVPDVPPADLAGMAYDEAKRRVTPPVVQLSPASGLGGVVGLESWLAVTPVNPIVAGPIAVPGLSATAIATVTSMQWTTGDGATVDCPLWGAVPPAGSAPKVGEAPCGWTPEFPSAKSVPGVSGGAFQLQVRLVWSVTWTASNGESGTFPDLTTMTRVAYPVREIQSIGEAG